MTVQPDQPACSFCYSAGKARRTAVICAAFLAVVLTLALPALATPPVLVAESFHQGPVRADPDDLLLLPGYGLSADDTIVYRAMGRGAGDWKPPRDVPRHSSDALGLADLVSALDAPYSLTVHLPSIMRMDQTYALWVVNAAGEWSNAVEINDARPLWMTPDEVYAHSANGSAPRVLKVVGRNLQAQDGSITQVRISGSAATFTLRALPNDAVTAPLARYVAAVELPPDIPAGTYQVSVSRDATHWVPLASFGRSTAQSLRVLDAPPAHGVFKVGDYLFPECSPDVDRCVGRRGQCPAEDSAHPDQTVCIAAAISAASAAGGGIVAFGNGIWRLGDTGSWLPGRFLSNKGVSRDGIIVPEGVSLMGGGAASTQLIRGEGWDMRVPAFALLRNSTISGFTFLDSRVYATDDSGSGFLSLGVRWDRMKYLPPPAPRQVSHVTISHNEFDRPFIAIAGGGSAVDHLVISQNTFGAFSTAIAVEGDPHDTSGQFHFSDSSITGNVFYPGSYFNPRTGQGAIATELSGGTRIDFTDNLADGASSRFLYDPAADAHGWRAAFFWSLSDSVEMLLVANNSASCTGDKGGDGEAISYDNNHNRPGFADLAVQVIDARSNAAADTTTVTVRGNLIGTQKSYGDLVDVSAAPNYYAADWLQIVSGPGTGQARKVRALSPSPQPHSGTVTFTVAPAFDVLPRANSRLLAGRTYWQVYTIGNSIDQRQPLCLKSNRTRKAGGLIALYASTVDSVVEGNRQYDTSGIELAHQFELRDAAAGIVFPGAMVQSANEIRGNLIDGAYDSDDESPYALKGIYLNYAATPHTAPPPTISHGLSVSHNTIRVAHAQRGIISLNQGWNTGPDSEAHRGTTPWKIAKDTLIFRNLLAGVDARGAATPQIGISAGNPGTPIEWRSVLYGNTCAGNATARSPLLDLGTQTVAYCPLAAADSCECRSGPADLAVSLLSRSGVPGSGELQRYTLQIFNNGPGVATDPGFSAEASLGLQVTRMSATGGYCDVADADVNLCHLNSIAPGQTARVDVTLSGVPGESGQVSFSVAHHEPDPDAHNDGLRVEDAGRGAGP